MVPIPNSSFLSEDESKLKVWPEGVHFKRTRTQNWVHHWYISKSSVCYYYFEHDDRYRLKPLLKEFRWINIMDSEDVFKTTITCITYAHLSSWEFKKITWCFLYWDVTRTASQVKTRPTSPRAMTLQVGGVKTPLSILVVSHQHFWDAWS